jgi:outer membrane protein assembly factor BamD (BamD/ComL family)
MNAEWTRIMNRNRKALLFCLAGFFLCQASAWAITNDRQVSSARDLLEQARVQMKAGKYMKAIYQYDLLLDNFKQSEQEASWALYEKSYCYYKLKKYGVAAKGFESIRREYPNAYGPITLAEKMLAKMDKRKERP